MSGWEILLLVIAGIVLIPIVLRFLIVIFALIVALIVGVIAVIKD